MNKRILGAATLLLFTFSALASDDIVSRYVRQRFGAERLQVREVQGLSGHITDGKLHLRLRDFIELVLKNSPDIQLTGLDVYTASDRIVSAEAPFDPVMALGFNTSRSVTPLIFGGGFGSSLGTGGTGGISGSGVGSLVTLPQTISSLSQTSSASYTQLLPTGQSLSASFTGIRSSGDGYSYPAVFGLLNFQLSQPLLQNRTNLQFRAPVTIARTELLITSEQTEATIGQSVAMAARQYWNAVQARENIRVQQQTLELAQKSYEHDKLALELGALASLDIYQSQTQVAERKRDLVQAQLMYRADLDGLRHLIGADLTPALRETEIVIEDDPSALPPRSEILPFEQALAKAMEVRPEFKAANQRLSVDDLSARTARDALLPQLNLTVQGGSSGPGLNPVTSSGTAGTPDSPYPGYGQTLRQVIGFDYPSYGLGIQLNFPFRNSSAKSQLADSLVSRAKDEYQKRSVQQQIILDVRQAIDNIELADASIAAATTARDLARKNVDAEQQKYQLGTITAFELLDSQNRLANTESALLNAYVTYQQAFVDYRRATWSLLDDFGFALQKPKHS